MKKSLKLAAAAVVAALCLSTMKPVRTFATVEGAYLYHVLNVNGPAYFFKSGTGYSQGIYISTGAYTGASSTGVPALPSGGVTMQIVGGQTTAARTACSSTNEGQIAYDSTVHSLAWCNGTSWYKLVDSGSSYSTSGNYWTAY